jgi:hypothetical protein
MKTKIRNSISGLLPLPLLLACFALLPSVQATPDPGAVGGGNSNAADGFGALNATVSGINNSGFGANALHHLTTGNNNAAQGNSALFSNVSGSGNTAIGVLALRLNTDGFQNTAVGGNALNSNIHGARNVALGYSALRSNTTDDNVAIGWQALVSNTNGRPNVAVGSLALASNTGGVNNTAVGFQALASSTAGNNTAVGSRALANTTGTANIALGASAGVNITSGGGNIDIGNPGAVFGESSTIRIGSASQSRTFIAGIRGVVPPVGVLLPVYIDLNGQLGNTVSSRRFKKEIKAMDNASEAIHALKPVTFHYKSDTTSTPQFGLIAEDVAAVNPDLVVRDENGEIYTVRYEAVNAMLLNEFLKEHRKNEEQEKTIAELKSGMTALAATVKEQASQIQKVSAQIEANEPAVQVVNNP